jgi:histone deacetylase 6
VPVPQKRTGVVYSAVMMLHMHPDEHFDRDEHPEKPERISAIWDRLDAHGCIKRMRRLPIRDALREEVMLAHDEGIWNGVEWSACEWGLCRCRLAVLLTAPLAVFTDDALASQTEHLNGEDSLYVNEHSAACARLSCGGVIEMVEAVVSGRIRNGFAIVRPPGHHAEPDRSMGFCFYNNVAVATKVALQKYGRRGESAGTLSKVLILDW